jgi:hypothetical protein
MANVIRSGVRYYSDCNDVSRSPKKAKVVFNEAQDILTPEYEYKLMVLTSIIDGVTLNIQLVIEVDNGGIIIISNPENPGPPLASIPRYGITYIN